MSAGAVPTRIADASPRLIARMTGVFYLVTLVAGVFAQGFVANRLIVPGDASATAAGILAHRALFEFGFTAYMIEMASNITMVVLFYRLLKPAGRTLATVAGALGLTGCVIKAFTRVFYITPLFLLQGRPHAGVLGAVPLQQQALLLLRVNDQGAGMALAFAGFFTVLTGWLMLRSIFLPRVLGWIAIIGGLGWLTFLSPTVGFRLFPYLASFGLLGALIVIAWLLIVGVDERRWWKQAGVTVQME